MDQYIYFFQLFSKGRIFIFFFCQAAPLLEDILGFIPVVPEIGF